MNVSFGEAIALAIGQAMEGDPSIICYGEGINDPGGYFGSTVGLRDKFGESRCFDVPNSEECLAGFGLGASLLGCRPVFVNLRADFLMLAMNQIVNHVAKWPSMSGHQCTAPLTIRAIVGKEWGQAAQHSGSYYSFFAHTPGLNVVLPASVSDAPGLLLSALSSDEPTLFIEAKTLYKTTGEIDLPMQPIALGEARVTRPGGDITFVAVSEMVSMAQSVACDLERSNVSAEVIDLRTISPLDEAAVLASIRKTRRVAVFDIGWQRFGLAAEIARLVSADPVCELKAPLLPVGREFKHTPASCFLEHDHYPTREKILCDVLALF